MVQFEKLAKAVETFEAGASDIWEAGLFTGSSTEKFLQVALEEDDINAARHLVQRDKGYQLSENGSGVAKCVLLNLGCSCVGFSRSPARAIVAAVIRSKCPEHATVSMTVN